MARGMFCTCEFAKVGYVVYGELPGSYEKLFEFLVAFEFSHYDYQVIKHLLRNSSRARSTVTFLNIKIRGQKIRSWEA